jgi:hypothetical protein
MALHRDIYWVGRQWAVTGYGVQACDQKQKGKFDIEASQLWEDDVLQSLRAHEWLNFEDFDKALSIARQRFPEPPRKPAPPSPQAIAFPVRDCNAAAPSPQAPKLEEPKILKVDPIEPASKIEELGRPELPKPNTVDPPRPPEPKFKMRFTGSAKFARPWRVRLKR